MAEQILRIGTRGSLLARAQSQWAADRIAAANPGLCANLVTIETTGDIRRDIPFGQVGTKGMFVKELETALLEGAIDAAVHSLKDMPAELPDGLVIGCIPPREDPRDALVSNSGCTLRTLPKGSVVGTSSIRRNAQIKAFRPDLDIRELRGNLDTRLRKLDAGEYDAIILACAGLRRLGLQDRISEAIDTEISMPAVGQGALAIEVRSADSRVAGVLAQLHCVDAADAIRAERSLLAALQGGCTVPAGALATVSEFTVTISAVIAAPNGERLVRASGAANRLEAEALGLRIATDLLANGGGEILKG